MKNKIKQYLFEARLKLPIKKQSRDIEIIGAPSGQIINLTEPEFKVLKSKLIVLWDEQYEQNSFNDYNEPVINFLIQNGYLPANDYTEEIFFIPGVQVILPITSEDDDDIIATVVGNEPDGRVNVQDNHGNHYTYRGDELNSFYDNPEDAYDNLMYPYSIYEATLKKQFKTYVVKWIEYPTGNRPYGGGGWSKRAKYRPIPEVKTIITQDVKFNGKTVYVNGLKKNKLNIYYEDGTPIREDYGNISFNYDTLSEARLKLPYAGVKNKKISKLPNDYINLSVSHGTFRSEDLIDSFKEFIEQHLRYLSTTSIKEFNKLQDEILTLDYDDNNNFDILDDIISDLFDVINDIAPEGTYFGAHPGDGSDFGFWESDESEFGEDDNETEFIDLDEARLKLPIKQIRYKPFRKKIVDQYDNYIWVVDRKELFEWLDMYGINDSSVIDTIESDNYIDIDFIDHEWTIRSQDERRSVWTNFENQINEDLIKMGINQSDEFTNKDIDITVVYRYEVDDDDVISMRIRFNRTYVYSSDNISEARLNKPLKSFQPTAERMPTTNDNSTIVETFMKKAFTPTIRSWGSKNLKIVKYDLGWGLLNYNTLLAFLTTGGRIYVNTREYSSSTKRIQNEIKIYAEGDPTVTYVGEEMLYQIAREANQTTYEPVGRYRQ